MALGDALNSESWEKIRTENLVPEYLKDTELEVEPRYLRGNDQVNDSHLIEQPVPEWEGDVVDDEGDVDPLDDLSWTESPWLTALKDLHNKEELSKAENLTVDDVNKFVPKENRIAKEVNVDNILQSRLRNPKRVHFE